MKKPKEGIHRHIFPHKVHDEIVTDLKKKMNKSYTEVVEYLIETMFGESNKKLKKYIKLRREWEKL